jgi:hypothetical protein
MSIAAFLFIAQSAFTAVPAAALDGQCIYPPGLGDPQSGEVRVTCSRVELDAGGIDFVDRSWNRRMLRFSGDWEGDRLTVHTVTPRSGATQEVRGLCRVYYANEVVSVIACTAVAGGRTWLGNFRASRI